METIGDRLKKLRNDYKFTQKQLGDYLGFDQSHIAKLENNKRNLRTDTLDDLCKLYNCSEEYIINGDKDYVKPNLNYRSNIRSLDLNTVAKMNPIIKNMTYLTKFSKEHENDYRSIYNSKLTMDVFSRANNCRRIWNIGEYDPIDIISVCLNKFNNITIVFFVANQNVSGSSIPVNGEWIIFVNSNHSLGRQRFTIAHELYHLLFGNNEYVNCSVNSNTKEELEADEFASYLLMSEGALLNYQLECGIENWNLDSILACEQYFQISRDAMITRLGKLNKKDNFRIPKYTTKIKYNAKKRGFSENLYVPYSKDKNLVMGSYIRLTQKAYDDEKITKGRKDELLRDAYYYDFLNNKNMEDLFA